MKAIQTNNEGKSQLISATIPELAPDAALIKTLGCGVCGTDILKISLKMLTKNTILGHEVVGRIKKIGNKVDGFNVGDLVVAAHHVPCFECHYCRHGNESMCNTFKKTNLVPGGFAEYFTLSADHLKHTTFKIPSEMSWQEALFTEPLACCVRNVDKLPLLKGDTVAIIGLGSIGLMMSSLLNLLEVKVIGFDLDDERCRLAQGFGVHSSFTSGLNSEIAKQAIEIITEHRGLDGIIFTAGPAVLLPQAISALRHGGFINLFSHLSGEMAPIDTADLYHKELQIITTYSATPKSLKKSFEILRDNHLDLKRMLTFYTPEDFNTAIADVISRNSLKAVIGFN